MMSAAHLVVAGIVNGAAATSLCLAAAVLMLDCRDVAAMLLMLIKLLLLLP